MVSAAVAAISPAGAIPCPNRLDKNPSVRVEHDFHDTGVVEGDTKAIAQCFLKFAHKAGMRLKHCGTVLLADDFAREKKAERDQDMSTYKFVPRDSLSFPTRWRKLERRPVGVLDI